MAVVDEFIAAHRSGWKELERLLGRAGQDPRRLDAPEIERLGQLYRHVTSDLALARRDFPRDRAAAYLNDLAARAHPIVYRAPAGSWRRIVDFFLGELPRLYRASGAFILLAFVLFILPAVAAYVVVLASPPLAEQILPPQVVRPVREGKLWTEIPPEQRPLVSTTIMTNNLQVSILAFAGGILLGTLTAYVLVTNGLLIGAVFGYTQAYGLGDDLLAFVSPHGYLELSVVFIAGGAGLQIAWAILSPGLLSRRDALSLAARHAVLLLVGAAPLLVIAGLIEGFVSPSALPAPLKLTVGPITGVLLYVFLLRTRARARALSASSVAV